MKQFVPSSDPCEISDDDFFVFPLQLLRCQSCPQAGAPFNAGRRSCRLRPDCQPGALTRPSSRLHTCHPASTPVSGARDHQEFRPSSTPSSAVSGSARLVDTLAFQYPILAQVGRFSQPALAWGGASWPPSQSVKGVFGGVAPWRPRSASRATRKAANLVRFASLIAARD